MKIRKIHLIILFIAFFSLIYSCRSRFNPKYYYNKTLGSSEDFGNGGNEFPDDFDPDDDIIDNGGNNGDANDNNNGGNTNNNGSYIRTNTIYLDPFTNGEWNSPSYKFDMNFDDYVIEASFSADNRPSYKLVRGGWNSSDLSKNEYYHNGAPTTGAGQSIQSVKYYLYKSKNPLFSATSKYNSSEKIKRFYFYRFTGKALGMVDTDNYLVAIDTYSKLVFAFAVPVQWKLYMAGTPKAPIKWGSVELGWEADYNSGNQASFKVDGASYFYEYDPVGIVKSDGTIEIYQWCLDSIGNNKKYGPRIDGGNASDLSRAIATYGKPGRSPYLPIKTNIIVTNGNVNTGNDSSNDGNYSDNEKTTKERITVTAKSLKNYTARSGEGWGKTMGVKSMWPPYYYDIKDYAFFAYGIGASVYDAEIPTETATLENFYANGVGIKTLGLKGGEKLKLKHNEQKTFSGENSYKLEVENIKEKEINIELASTLFKYNLLLDYIDTDNFGKNGSRDVSRIDGGQKIVLSYDSKVDGFVVAEAGPKYFNSTQSDNSKTVEIRYDNSFILKRGEKKDFRIWYYWDSMDSSLGYYEIVDIVYSLEFKSIN